MFLGQQEFVSLGSLARRFGLPERYLKRLSEKDLIPYLNVNGRLLFNIVSVQQALDKLASKGKTMDRDSQIAVRCAQIPRAFKATYERAVKGKSLRAAVNAQCLECCFWQIKEIRYCTDSACPLYAVRPYQDFSQTGHNGQFSNAESKKTQVEA